MNEWWADTWDGKLMARALDQDLLQITTGSIIQHSKTFGPSIPCSTTSTTSSFWFWRGERVAVHWVHQVYIRAIPPSDHFLVLQKERNSHSACKQPCVNSFCGDKYRLFFPRSRSRCTTALFKANCTPIVCNSQMRTHSPARIQGLFLEHC